MSLYCRFCRHTVDTVSTFGKTSRLSPGEASCGKEDNSFEKKVSRKAACLTGFTNEGLPEALVPPATMAQSVNKVMYHLISRPARPPVSHSASQPVNHFHQYK